MSTNTVNAAIEIADETDFPVMLIASRRQVDCKQIKRGYVNNWSTEEFVKYVQSKSKKNNVIIARDHGGPWQNTVEVMKKYNLKDAMKSALDSFYIDIDSGFDILHLDPSINIYGQVSGDEILDRLLELYSACEDYAFKTKKVIEYEIGTEEQMTYFNDKTEYVKLLNQVLNACKSNKWKLPLFVVTQVGTKVIEMQNIGILNQNNNEKVFSYVSELAQECLNHNFFMKVHNTDYLKHEALRLFPKYKISAANVAPEFGVCETKSLINFLEKYNLPQFINEFLNISYNSNKWEKWLMPNSTLTNRDKAIIAGHYVFSTDEFLILKDKIQKQIKNVNLDDYLKNKVKDCILTYLKLFRVNNTLEEELICTR